MSAAFLLFASAGRVSAADPFAESARELAGKIQNNLGPLKRVEFTFQSLSSLGAADLESARRALEKEMRARGIRFGADPKTTVAVAVTLSENMQQYLWIAEIARGGKTEVVMTSQEQLPLIPVKDVALYLTIQTRLIFEQEVPILDLKLMDDRLLVLNSDALALYQRVDEKWELRRSLPLKSQRPMPRDARGKITDTGETVQIYLPGLFCRGAAIPDFAFECSQEEKSWPFPPGGISLATSGNYFVHEKLPPLFSIAGVKEAAADFWIVAGTDGRTGLYDSALMRIDEVNNDGWGSEIADISADCGETRHLLVSLRTDPLEHGAIQAFEIINRKAVARSSAVELPGPVTSLWQVTGRNAAVVVSRDLKTGHYAAFYLSISCGR